MQTSSSHPLWRQLLWAGTSILTLAAGGGGCGGGTEGPLIQAYAAQRNGFEVGVRVRLKVALHRSLEREERS